MSRAVVIYLLALPLALFSGYLLATPTDFNSFAFLMLTFMVLSVPMLLKHHHLMLAWTWNAALILFFLPGQPQVGVVLAFLSLGISLVTRTLSKQRQFIRAPSLTAPLLIILVVVLVTAKLTGGIGGRVFGAETRGAKRYFGVFGAIAGYFAMTAVPIPREKAKLYLGGFFLGGVTSLVSDLVFMAGPQFYFLFVLFPSDFASMQAVTADALLRLSGISYACCWAFFFFIGRYGINGLFDFHAPWRLLLLSGCLIGSLFGGFRGLLILMALVFAAQFFVERIYRQKLGPILVLGTTAALAVTIAFIDHLPLSVQRAFSIIPFEKIDPRARQDALGSLDWRLSMWKLVLPEVPKYLILGKGYGFSGTDYYLTQESMRRGLYASYEDTLISGNYHNGILTLIIPFGIFGFAAFLWFCGSAWVALVRNLRYGDPQLRNINTFLLSYFCARLLMYFIFYGQFELDLPQFTGVVGLSLAINGGIRTKEAVELEYVPDEAIVAAPA